MENQLPAHVLAFKDKGYLFKKVSRRLSNYRRVLQSILSYQEPERNRSGERLGARFDSWAILAYWCTLLRRCLAGPLHFGSVKYLSPGHCTDLRPRPGAPEKKKKKTQATSSFQHIHHARCCQKSRELVP